MAAREILQIVEESAYKTAATAVRYPTSSFNLLVLRLDEGNAFSMRPAPMISEVMYGGGFAVPAYPVSDQIECQGNLRVKLCYSQAKILMDWGLTRINAGGTVPWTTTEPPGDLASCSIYHGVWQDNTNTYLRKLYKGVKVSSLGLEVSRDSRIMTANFGLRASVFEGNQFDSSVDPTSTPFPIPTEAEYVTDPILFLHAAGGLTLPGGAHTQFNRLSLNVQNALDPRWFENRFVNVCRGLGRTVTLDADLFLKSTPTDRTAFEGQTAGTSTIVFTNGVNTATFALNAQTRINKLDDDLSLERVYMRKLTAKSYWDPTAAASAGADLLFTYA